MSDVGPGIDVPHLLAQVRAGDEGAMKRAYAMVFGSELGKLVLLHHALACGVGRRFGCDASDAQLRYSAGMMDSAIQLANDAGYDEAALAAGALLTQELADERNPHDDEFGTILPAAARAGVIDADDL